MSLSCYDEALEIKLKNVFGNVMRVSSDRAFKDYASYQEGIEDTTVRLPLITFYRMDNQYALDKFENFHTIRDGFVVGDKYHRKLPIEISYQLSIWSDRREEVDDIFRELSMYLYNQPDIDVKFEGIEQIHSYATRLVNTRNLSEPVNLENTGYIYRQVIDLIVPNADLIFVDDIVRVKDINVRTVVIKPQEVSDVYTVKQK